MFGAGIFNYFYAFEYHLRGRGKENFSHLLNSGRIFETIIWVAIILAISLLLSVAGRIAIIQKILFLERKQEMPLSGIFKRVRSCIWRAFGISLSADLVLLVVAVWLFTPVIYLFITGLAFRGAMLSMFAAIIFVPIFATLSLVNFFAAGFIVVYDLKYLDAFKNSFDLAGRFWDLCLVVLAFLAAAYVLFFIASAGIFGVLNNLAYLGIILVQSISAGVSHFVSSALSVILLAVSIFAAAILNAYANSVLALLFLRIVKDKRAEEESAAPVVGTKPAA